MKECTDCKEIKEIGDFYKNSKMADGHLNRCKVCFSVYKKRYWIENKDKLREYKRRHRAEKSEHYKEYAKSYRESNIDEIKKKEKERRAKNKEKIKEYEKKYSSSDSGKEVRKRIAKRYLSTDKGKALIKRAQQKYIERNPIKKRCHNAVGKAIRSGKLIPRQICECCGLTNTPIHAHHDDYALPLLVRWLCVQCHFDWHKENGEGLNANKKTTNHDR